jgi:hypothetical protein
MRFRKISCVFGIALGLAACGGGTKTVTQQSEPPRRQRLFRR